MLLLFVCSFFFLFFFVCGGGGGFFVFDFVVYFYDPSTIMIKKNANFNGTTAVNTEQYSTDRR